MKLICLLLVLLCTVTCRASEEEAAARAIGHAMYKQFKIDDSVNLFIQERVPPELKQTASKVIMTINIVVKQKVELAWSF